MTFARVTDEPLDVAHHLAAVSGPEFGAVVTFIGQVRDHVAPDGEAAPETGTAVPTIAPPSPERHP